MIKEIIKPIAVLACICLLVTAVLAYVNTITSPVILAAAEKAASEARAEVLTEADGRFEKLEISGLPDGVTEVYKGGNDSGYVIITQSKGYGGDIKLICGIRADGSIEKIKTLSHGETSGIGSKVADNKSGYAKHYNDKTAADYRQVDAVSGATISSKAYQKAVGLAFKAFSKVKGAV